MNRADQLRVAKEWLNHEPLSFGCKVLHEAIVMYVGWELDNVIAVIEGPDGRFLVGSSHGGPTVETRGSLNYAIGEHEEALKGLLRAKELMDERA